MSTNGKVVGSFNRLQMAKGEKGPYMTTYFDHPDGFYYDPVGDEIFEVERMWTGQDGIPVYRINFGDEQKVGVIMDHGLHLHLK